MQGDAKINKDADVKCVRYSVQDDAHNIQDKKHNGDPTDNVCSLTRQN
jgi:hypothetical protein